ncbi:MAG TPA: hypothetical protein PLO47_00560 [Bacillota bacterium]|nr:hypothetical protein [Bacillota bacterium]
MNKALFKENLKRFWPISLAGFIFYFLNGPFTLLSATRGEQVYDAVISAAGYVGFLILDCLLPVAVAAAVFSYLFKPNSTTLMHSLPFSRRLLFVSNGLSGLLLSVLPVLINKIIMIALVLGGRVRFTLTSWNGEGVEESVLVTMLTALLTHIAVIAFVYAMSCVSAVISGSSVINVLTSCGLNLLTTFVLMSSIVYSQYFLKGYCSGDETMRLAAHLHPAPYFVMSSPGLGYYNFEWPMIHPAISALIYIAVAALIAAAAYFIYTKRPNERAGDSYVFDVVGLIIGTIMVYFGSSFVGFIFINTEGFGIWGFVLGGAIALLIGQMIIKKSVRIFNAELIKPLLLSVLVMGLVFGAYSLDLFGYEKRTPNPEKVGFARIDGIMYSCSGGLLFKEKESIEALTEFHRELVASEDVLGSDQDSSHVPDIYNRDAKRYIIISYALPGGGEIKRSYIVPVSLMRGSASFKELIMYAENEKVYEQLLAYGPSQIGLEFWDCYDRYYGGYTTEEFYASLGPLHDSYEKFSDEEKMELWKTLISESGGPEKTFELACSNGEPYFSGVIAAYVDHEVASPYNTYVDNSQAHDSYIHNFQRIYNEDGKVVAVREEFIFEVTPESEKSLELIYRLIDKYSE